MDNDNKLKFATLILTLVISIGSVLALGVDSPYWEDNPLKMYPGETKEVSFTLKNSIEEKSPARAIVSLIESAGIAEIISEEEFIVPPGSNDNKIIIKVSIPQNAKIGDSYSIKFAVTPSPEEKEGNIQLRLQHIRELPIIVGEKTAVLINTTEQPANLKKTNISTISAIIIIIIIILSIIISAKLIKRRKQV